MIDLINFGKALSDPTRIRILRALLQCELCVCELVDALQVSQSTISTHLKSLRSSGVVDIEKRQTWIIYSIAEKYITPITNAIEALPIEDAQIDRDHERIANRLKLRIDGCCVIGSTTTKKEKEYSYVNN